MCQDETLKDIEDLFINNPQYNFKAVGFAGGFDTGGYTGQWGSEGKLAVLHEKEIVLNKHDTANMFKIVDLTRSIIDSIGNFNLNSLFNKPDISYQNIGNLAMRDQTIKQEVHIQADFPNVQDHNEIELAMENLVNTASQYANRKT